MMEDKIHDALNLLDDDLIGEVEWLRSRKKKRHLAWIPSVATVACIGIFTIHQFDMNMDSTGNSSGPESMNMGGQITSGTDTEGSIDQEGIIETPSVLVQIQSWETNGFTGTVVGHVDTDIFPIGTEVFVELAKCDVNNDNMTHSITQESKPLEGSVVRVQFYAKEEGEKIILHAEDVEFSKLK